MILKLRRSLKLKIKHKIKKFKPIIVASPLKIWIFSILAFFGEVILFSKYPQSHNGFYAPYQSTIFLITILTGVIAFTILALSIALKFSRKLWLKSKMLFLFIIALMIVSPVGAYYLADAKLFNNPNSQQMVQGVQQSIPTFTGQDVFDAVNNYRKSKGIGELSLDKILCNNLAQRYLDIQTGIKEGTAHKGFDEWYEKYVQPYGNYRVEEDFASGNTPQDVIKAWEGSPGHRLSILDKTLNFGCSYALEGSAVIVLGRKQGYSPNTNSQQTSNSQKSQQPKYDGSRTGRIIDYNSLCEGKTIKVYENELIPYKRITGEIIYTTKGDIKCYEDQINQFKQQYLGSDNNVQSQPVSNAKEAYNPVTCVLSYGTYQLSQSSCDESKRNDPQYIKCELRNGTYSMTKEECIKEQQSDVDNFIGEVYQQYNQEEQRKTNLSNCLTKASEEKDRMLQWESTQNSTTEIVRQQIYRNWGQAKNGCHTLYGY